MGIEDFRRSPSSTPVVLATHFRFTHQLPLTYGHLRTAVVRDSLIRSSRSGGNAEDAMGYAMMEQGTSYKLRECGFFKLTLLTFPCFDAI